MIVQSSAVSKTTAPRGANTGDRLLGPDTDLTRGPVEHSFARTLSDLVDRASAPRSAPRRPDLPDHANDRAREAVNRDRPTGSDPAERAQARRDDDHRVDDPGRDRADARRSERAEHDDDHRRDDDSDDNRGRGTDDERSTGLARAVERITENIERMGDDAPTGLKEALAALLAAIDAGATGTDGVADGDAAAAVDGAIDASAVGDALAGLDAADLDTLLTGLSPDEATALVAGLDDASRAALAEALAAATADPATATTDGADEVAAALDQAAPSDTAATESTDQPELPLDIDLPTDGDGGPDSTTDTTVDLTTEASTISGPASAKAGTTDSGDGDDGGDPATTADVAALAADDPAQPRPANQESTRTSPTANRLQAITGPGAPAATPAASRVAATPAPTSAPPLVELADAALADQLRPAFAAVRRGLDGMDELKLRIRDQGGAPIKVDIKTADDKIKVILTGDNHDLMQRLGQERDRLADELRRAGFAQTSIDVHSEGADSQSRSFRPSPARPQPVGDHDTYGDGNRLESLTTGRSTRANSGLDLDL